MKKRILLVVLLLVGLLFVASCDKKEPAKETFALTLPSSITSNQEDNAKILKDTNVVITITVPEGKEIDSLKVDGVEKKADVVSNKLSFKMTKNITVTVSFKNIPPVEVYYALTLPSGIKSNQSNNAKILENTNVELTITIPDGQRLASLKVDGVEKKADVANNKLTVKMTKDITVTVAFEDIPLVVYELTLPNGVTSNQDDNSAIAENTDVVLTVTVPAGKKIGSLKVDGVEKKADVVNNKLTVKMTKDITVTVAFDDIVYALTLPNGVASDQTNNSAIKVNTDVVLTVTVPAGKKLASLKVDGVEKKADVVNNKLTVKMTKDITVTVVFDDIVYALTLPKGVTSDQTDNSAIKVNTDVVLTVVAPEGKKLSSLKVDGVEKKADVANNKLTVKMTKDITVTVAFEDIVYALTLPEGVTSNQTNNSAIVVNTDVVLTVTVAEGKAIESLKVDGVEKVNDLSTDYKLTIKMTKDITVTVGFRDLAPELTRILYHWMPGAISDTTGLKANIDLLGATYDDITGDGLTVKIGEITLEYILDYDIIDNELVVVGQALQDANLELGDHQLSVTSSYGTSSMEFHVVNNPIGTSIPTKTIQSVDMKNVAAYKPTAPIAGAPALLITELGLDRGVYDYIEVFNNTNEVYNLKNHYIIFGNTDQQALLQEYGLFHVSNSARSSAFIYKDFEIPALSSAYIWVANGVPWKTRKPAEGENPLGLTHEIYIDNENLIYGSGENQLNESKFRATYNLPEDTLVFFVRLNYTLFNNPHKYSSTTGFGSPVCKNVMWASNSSVDNRAVQILKISVDKKHNIPSGDTTVPSGATYFKWVFGVENKEEDVFVNGVLDKTKIKIYGQENSIRESINALYIRRVFYNASDEFVGFSTDGTNELDLYNITNTGLNAPKFLDMWKSMATAVVTAHFYPRLTKVDGEIVRNKWEAISLEYTIPSASMPGLMRFVQREEESLYAEFYGEPNALIMLKLAGLAPAVSDTLMNKEIIVPENPGYPTDYITSVYGYTTIGRTTWYNFLETKPEE